MSAAERSPYLTGDSPAASSPQGVADRRELVFIAVERTRMPMVVTDPRQPDNPIVLANKAYLDLGGFTADEVIGRNCRIMQGPETSSLALTQIRAAIAAQKETTVELLNYRKDGTTFWNQLFISPVHDDAGRLIYFFGSQLDVTRRRKAQELEAAEHLLLREIDHRALNALAVVQGIVRLSRSDNVDDYANAVQGRVGALARAHILLANQGWKDGALDQLLQGEVQPYGGRRAKLTGPPVGLAPQLVQPLALAFHELAVNAASHGALSGQSGSLEVTWSEDVKTGDLRINWRESGGPEPSTTRSSGFGSSMIKAIVERQLKGRLDMDWRSEGLEVRMTIPNVALDAIPPADDS